MTEAATRKLAEEIAKQAAAQAKADAVSEAIAQVNELLKGYATKEELGDVAAQIAGISNNLNTLTNDFNEVKALQQQMKVQLDALKKYEEYGTQIGVMQKDIDAVKGDIIKIQQALENCVTADQMKKAIDEVSASLAKKNAAVITLLTGMLRSMVFIPEAYVDGIESALYDYLEYNPIAAKKPSGWSDASQKGSNNSQILTDGSAYGWDNWSVVRDNKNQPVVNFDFQPRTLNFDLNPSTAKFTADQVNLVARFVTAIDTRAEFKWPELKVDKASTVTNKDGVLSVGYTIDNAFNIEVLRSLTQNGGLAYMAQATVAPEANDTTGNGNITSDAAQIVGMNEIPEYIAYVPVNNAYSKYVISQDIIDWRGEPVWGEMTNRFSAPESAVNIAAFTNIANIMVPYNESLDLNNVLTTTFTDGTVATYDAMQAYGLTFDYTLIDYTWGGFDTSESAYCTFKGSTITPCGVTADGKPLAAPNKSSIGKQPLVFVKLMHGEDVVKVGFVKVKIVEKLEAEPITINPIVLSNVPFICNGDDNRFSGTNFGYATWSQISNILLGAIDGGAGMSKDQFFMNYGLIYGSYGAVQYVKDEKTGVYTPFEDIKPNAKQYIGFVQQYNDFANAAGNNVIRWGFDAAEAQMAYDLKDHTITTYVAFAKKNADGSINENTAVKYYVPLQVTIYKPQGTIVNKVAAMWMRDSKTNILSTPVPMKTGNSVDEYSIALDNAWWHNPIVNGKPNTAQQLAGPVLNGLPANLTTSIADGGISTTPLINFTNGAIGANGYKYYFAAASDQTVTMPIDGVTKKVVFKASSAGKSTNFKTPAVANDILNTKGGVVVNAENQLTYGLTIASTPLASVYDNTTLYAAILNTNQSVSNSTVFTPIATIDQSTGIVTYEYNNVSKPILNAYASLEKATTGALPTDRPTAVLGFEIGVVFYGPCGLVVPVTNGEYPAVFLRPLNILGNTGKEFNGYKPDGSTLNVKDLINFFDWTGTAIVKNTSWMYSWYEIKSFTLDTDNILSNAADPNVFAINPTVNNCFKTSVDLSSPVTAASWADFDKVATLGTITYTGSPSISANAYKVRIPVTVEYYWGKLYVMVEATVNTKN